MSYHFGPIGFPQKGKETEGIIKNKKVGIRGEIFTLGTLLYVDSLYVGFRSLEPQKEGGKNWWVG